jgi:hypothetical protein
MERRLDFKKDDREKHKGMQVEKISNSQKLNLRKSIGESREDFG